MLHGLDESVIQNDIRVRPTGAESHKNTSKYGHRDGQTAQHEKHHKNKDKFNKNWNNRTKPGVRQGDSLSSLLLHMYIHMYILYYIYIIIDKIIEQVRKVNYDYKTDRQQFKIICYSVIIDQVFELNYLGKAKSPYRDLKNVVRNQISKSTGKAQAQTSMYPSS